MFIEQPSRWFRWLFPRALWRKDPSQPVVYLTFDDGPIPEATPFVLEVLKERGIRATFFLVGENAQRYPHLLQAILDAGHSIGNHTFNHYAGFRHSTDEYIDNISRADALLHSPLFRPPHGWMKQRQYKRLRERYTIVMWDLVTRDYSRRLTPEDIYNNVVRYARNGSIITFHDSLRSIDKLHKVLPQCLDYLISEGFSFDVL